MKFSTKIIMALVVMVGCFYTMVLLPAIWFYTIFAECIIVRMFCMKMIKKIINGTWKQRLKNGLGLVLVLVATLIASRLLFNFLWEI